jgi:hypothetical protein
MNARPSASRALGLTSRLPSEGVGRIMPRVGARTRTTKNALGKVELGVAREHKTRRKRHRYKQLARAREAGIKTRIGKKVAKGTKLVPPVPENKTLAEIREMPAESVEFRHPQGRPRRWHNPDGSVKTEPETWRDVIRREHQRYYNEQRDRVRKWEAEVVVAQKVLSKRSRDPRLPESQVDDEDRLIAESVLDLEDWDNEELIRGYRRNRSGRFGEPPKYISREIQQEAFRRLIGRGERKMKQAYIEAVEQLVKLARSANSEKTRLEAIKVLMERVVGKVPDIVHVSQEAPWEAMLADAIVPLSEAIPFELTPNDDGVYALEAAPESEPESGGEVETSTDDAARRIPTTKKAPSPSRRAAKKE